MPSNLHESTFLDSAFPRMGRHQWVSIKCVSNIPFIIAYTPCTESSVLKWSIGCFAGTRFNICFSLSFYAVNQFVSYSFKAMLYHLVEHKQIITFWSKAVCVFSCLLWYNICICLELHHLLQGFGTTFFLANL